jgi:hypothetical protein
MQVLPQTDIAVDVIKFIFECGFFVKNGTLNCKCSPEVQTSISLAYTYEKGFCGFIGCL